MLIRAARPVIAMDRSLRTYDRDGRLHVARSNISKANVGPYLGREIPGNRDLGLDPNKIYHLYRHPEELAKAAPTFNNLPILSRHIPVTAEYPEQGLIVGTTGTDSVFNDPYLQNSTTFWTSDSIRNIESRRAVQLSAAYHFTVDMTPGEIDGLHFDGIMRNIIGNHVAQVERGRAGPDVVVGDSKLEIVGMARSRFASLLVGAAAVALRPVLAQDAAIDVQSLTRDVKDGEDLPKFLNRLERAAVGNLAQDASFDSVRDALSPLAEMAMDGDDDEDDTAKDSDKDDEDDTAKDSDKDDDKPAMDAALITRQAEERATRRVTALFAAKDKVRPLVGEITVAMDSAADVFTYALKQTGMKNLSGKHSEESLSAMVDLKLEAHTAARTGGRPTLAQDSAAPKPGLTERYPQLNRLVSA